MDSSLTTNFTNFRTEILRKILLRPPSPTYFQENLQENAGMNPIRPNLSSGVLMTSSQPPQSSLAIPHNLVTHTISNMKTQNSTSYPLQLHLGGATTVNVPVQLGANPGGVPLQLTAPVSLPTNIPVQLPGGAAVNVPLQFPASQSQMLPSVPILQTSSAQPPYTSSIIHVHMGANTSRSHGITSTAEGLADTVFTTISHPTPSASVTSSNNPIHMMPSTASTSSLQLGMNVGSNVSVRSNIRVPQVVYINPTTHKPVSSANTIANPKQIIVRRPVTSSSGIQFVSNVNSKSNLAPKLNLQNKSSVLASGTTAQPIVIQKPKINSNMVPVSIATNSGNKQAFAYLGSVKKPIANKANENQSILIQNNQISAGQSSQTSNQKLFLAPMNMPKMQNTKYILPVSLPGAMASKGPIINLQIANGQIQNDPQGNITVMRDSAESEVPPFQPLPKPSSSLSGKDTQQATRNDKPFALSIPGSRAEPTGEQEYTLSIPETNASMNDDIYTVSIAEEDEGNTREKSFTLAIPEKGKSLLNKPSSEKNESTNIVPAPAILRRSNSENNDIKASNLNIKRRISLCTEKVSNKNHFSLQKILEKSQDLQEDSDNNDDHEVPSLFCDEQLDKDLEMKGNLDDNDAEDCKNKGSARNPKPTNSKKIFSEFKDYKSEFQDIKPEVEIVKKEIQSRMKRASMDSTSEEDPPGLLWNNGVAQLQGSNIHFQTNEFGLIDVMDRSEQENNFLLNPSAKYQTPLKQRIGNSGREKKPTSPEDLYCCDGCGCHGMAADFITPNFCSLTCQQVYQKLAPQKKKERDKADMLKRKNKMKKLLTQQRQELFEKEPAEPIKPSESDLRLNPLLLKVEKEPFENEKYPWMCGTNGFSWMRYLDYCKAKAAPTRLFARDPFPYNCKNGFRMGMKLEAIDPVRPAVFSVVTVVETQGYRMRLHFDSYPESYDFWVNADSIDIFPPGWCEKNGRVLKPPQGYTTTNFNWTQYLKQCKAVAAPRHLFPHMCQGMLKPNGFRIGMKLEAEDRKNKLMCVASVSDILDNRVLINFDSWDEKYDYWVDPTSPYIHAVGWAEENGHSLTPPNFYKDPDSFTWEGYLRETGTAAVPPRAFKPRPPHGFKVGMKLEVVDRRVPFLIRVATVSKCTENSVCICYDGWPDEMSVWMDDDSADIHPVGWCLKTGHPLEPPLTAEELSIEGPCGVGGCRGLGSLRGGPHKTHTAPSQCPYKPARPPSPQDRLDYCTPHATHLLPKTRTVYSQPRVNHNKEKGGAKTSTSTPPADSQREKNTKVRPAKHKRVEEVTKSVENIYDEDSNASSTMTKRSRSEARAGEAEVEASVLAAEYEVRSGRELPAWNVLCTEVAVVMRELPLPHDPRDWTQEDVRDFIESASVSSEVLSRFSKHRITGPDLLMLSQEEMVDILGIKLGPAIKIYSSVLQLRKMVVP